MPALSVGEQNKAPGSVPEIAYSFNFKYSEAETRLVTNHRLNTRTSSIKISQFNKPFGLAVLLSIK